MLFYGTLMAPFNRPGRQRITPKLTFKGRGTIRAALYDLGIYPAAIPADDNSTLWGETYEASEAASVLAALDEIEGYRPNEPERSLYTRVLADVTLEDATVTPLRLDACKRAVIVETAPKVASAPVVVYAETAPRAAEPFPSAEPAIVEGIDRRPLKKPRERFAHFAITLGLGATYDVSDALHLLGYAGANIDRTNNAPLGAWYASLLFTF